MKKKYISILKKNLASKYTDTPDDDQIVVETCDKH
jgi:hypothetical protein